MPELNLSFNLSSYLANLETAITTEFGMDFKTYALFPVRDDMEEARYKNVALPALFIDMYESESDESYDQKTEQLGVNLYFSAHLLYPMNYRQLQLQIRVKALQLAQLIFKSRKFNSPVDRARIERIAPDYELNDRVTAFTSWVVEWEHYALLGDSVFDPDPKPTEAFVGFKPNIGAVNESSYERQDLTVGN